MVPSQAGMAAYTFITQSSNYLFLGGQKFSGITQYSIMSGADAMAIDAKLDDGKPASGNIVAWNYEDGDPICTTTQDASTALYDVRNWGNCSLIINIGF
jgi:hypothetical protein